MIRTGTARATRASDRSSRRRSSACPSTRSTGQSICPYHYEIGFDEWLIVLTGRPTLRTPEGEQELRAWDVAFFPDGEAGAHKVTNNTETALRVALLSNKRDPGAAVYPDSDKVGIFPPNKLFRLGDAVDYWDGELPTGASSLKVSQGLSLEHVGNGRCPGDCPCAASNRGAVHAPVPGTRLCLGRR